MELLRYQIFAATGISLLSIWLALLNNSTTASNPLVLYAPVWSVLLLGLYAIISVILGTMSFKDCPEAAAEIETQIKEAKTEMKKRGIIKDWLCKIYLNEYQSLPVFGDPVIMLCFQSWLAPTAWRHFVFVNTCEQKYFCLESKFIAIRHNTYKFNNKHLWYIGLRKDHSMGTSPAKSRPNTDNRLFS